MAPLKTCGPADASLVDGVYAAPRSRRFRIDVLRELGRELALRSARSRWSAEGATAAFLRRGAPQRLRGLLRDEPAGCHPPCQS